MVSKKYLSRIRFFSVLIVLIALVFIIKLFYVQVLKRDLYSEEADRQYATPVSNIFDRGSIFFLTKDGTRVEAATITSGYKVAINPVKIVDNSYTYKKLSSVISIDEDNFNRRASNKNDTYEEIALKISKEEADKIKSMNLDGVYIYKEKWRFYPGSSLASRVLGFVAYNGNILSGRYGLERYYNDVLQRNSEDLYVNFFAEVFSNIGASLFKDTQREGDIVTTIEPNVQNQLEKTVQDLFTKWNAESAGGIVINPRTGAIYAMASVPSFDLNYFNLEKDVKIYRNPLVEDVFEFGSIIKPLTMAAGIDTGIVSADTTYYDSGSVSIEDAVIQNYDKKGRGKVTMQDVLNQSLNTGAVFVMDKLGKDTFRKYMYRYGIGEKKIGRAHV